MTVNSTSINLIATNTSHQLKDAVNPGFWPGAFAVKWIDLLSPDFWITVFLIAMLLSIASWAIGSRKSIILLQFSNQTGDEKLKSSVEAISSILQNELARLVRLINQVDDTNPFGSETQIIWNKDSIDRNKKANEPFIKSNISVSIGESLKSIVSTDTKAKLGSFEIPIGATIGLLAKLIEGPQLTGNLLKEDGNLVLIASLNGGGYSEEWRISSSDPEVQESASVDPLAQMTQQLTYRIFTSLTKEELGSPSWKAVLHYIKGLRDRKSVV